MSKIYDLVVVGAGPCGIGGAIEASSNGLSVLLLEKGDSHSQTIKKFYKDGKRVDKSYKGQDSTILGVVPFEDGTKESTVELFDKLLSDYNIELKVKSEVESVKKDGDLFKVATPNGIYEGKNVLVSIGKMGKPNKPDYKAPPSVNSLVNYNLNNCKGNEKVLVVGGGNSAVEYVIELSAKNEASIAYRRDTFSRVNDTNKDELFALEKDSKLRVMLNHDVVSLEDDNSRVKVNFSNGSSETFDRVVYAIGGSSPVDFLQKCSIQTDEKGVALVDENSQSNVEGLYVGGDIAQKSGGSIVVGLNNSYKAVQSIKSRG